MESRNQFPKRKPFHYNTLKKPIVTSDDADMAAKFSRYRYISRLSRHNLVREELNTINFNNNYNRNYIIDGIITLSHHGYYLNKDLSSQVSIDTLYQPLIDVSINILINTWSSIHPSTP